MKQKIVFLSLLLFLACSPVKKAGDESTPFLDSVLKPMGFEIANFFPAQKGSILIIPQRKSDAKQQRMNEIIAEKLTLYIVSVNSIQTSIIDKSVAISAFGDLSKFHNFSFLNNKENINKLNKLGLKYLLIVDTQPVIQTELIDPQIDSLRYYLRTNLQVKAIEVQSSKIIWAKQSTFYFPLKKVIKKRRYRNYRRRDNRHDNNRRMPPPRR